MKKYQSYKPSGMEWIGDIPEHWESKSLKYLVKCNEKALTENTDPNYDLEYIEISDVDSSGKINNTTAYLFKDSPSRCRRILSKGDVLVSSVRTYLKSIGFIEDEVTDLICSTGFCVLTPNKNIISKYLFYQVLTEYFIGKVISKSEGVSYPSITSSELINIKIVLPTVLEQHQIIRFLDDKTGIIDTLISTKERKIDLLKQQRTSLINQVITKGLDLNVKLKDSGVEWIGEIPVHWGVSKFKYASEIVTGNTPSKTEMETYYTEDEKGLLWVKPTSLMGDKYVNTSEEKLTEEGKNKTKVIPKNSIMICCIGNTIGKYGMSGEVLSTNQQINSVVVNEEVISSWYCLYYIDVFTRDLIKWCNYVTLPIYTKSDLEDTLIIIPPHAEQKQIVEYIQKRAKEIDDLISLEQKKIDVLKEYRQSLISEVITGKIDVRNN